MYQEVKTYLKKLSEDLLQGSRVEAFDGTCLYTPDGVANYNALWLRDFSYMVEYAPSLIPKEDIIACIEYSIAHRRKDGWMPDRVTGEGKGIYAAGEAGAPIGEANLDNTPFLVYTVYSLSLSIEKQKFLPLLMSWLPYLEQGLSLIPLSPDGLVFNEEAQPHSPYGFTDTVCKTGRLYMESLLFWRACRMMEKFYSAYIENKEKALFYASMAENIEKNIHILKESSLGVYYAASSCCRQIDLWGMAYMIYINFPITESEKESILTFLVSKYEDYIYQGQVRHLLKGEYWERLLIEIEHETYQNGAYWATATGWLAYCLAQKSPVLAQKTIMDVVACFKNQGSFECINKGYKKLPSFVVSATNVYGGLCRLMNEFPEIFPK